jgi:hypothetical protein
MHADHAHRPRTDRVRAHRARAWRTRVWRALAATLVVATSLAVGGTADAQIVAASISVGADGSGFGSASQCDLEDVPGTPVDATTNDGVVCTNDTVMFLWTFSIDAAGAQHAVFAQTLPVGWWWDAGAAAWCTGTGGVAVMSNDDRTLECTIDVAAGISVGVSQLQMVAHVGATAPDSSTYDAQLDVTQDGGPTHSPTASTVTVRSAPRYELHKQATGGQSVGSHDFGSGAEPAVFVDFRAWIDIANSSNTKGVEAIVTPLTYVDDLTSVSPNAVLTSCGQMAGSTTTCDQPGGPGTDVTIEITTPSGLLGTATSSVNPSVSASAVHVATHRIALPLAEVPAAPIGADVMNRFGDFHPVGVHGTPNFNGTPEQGSEPGADCSVPAANDNCAAAHLTGVGGGGSGIGGSKQLRRAESAGGAACPAMGTHDVAGCPGLVGDTGSENGSVTPGTSLWARTWVTQGALWEGGYPTVTNLAVCDSWDPTLQTIDPARAVRVGYPSALDPADYLVEFTNRDSADDTARRNAGCGLPGDDVTAGPWFDSIAAAGGAGAVTAVRVTHLDPAGFDGQHFMMTVPMIAGSVAGAVPDFFGARWDENVAGTNGYRYLARNGYRVTPQQISIDKNTVPANTMAVAAGAEVEYSLQAAVVVPGNPAPDPVDPVTVVDTMHRCTSGPVLSPTVTDWTMAVTTAPNVGPDGLGCTGDAGEAGAVVTFTHVGPVTPNTTLQPIRYRTTVSPFATNTLSVTNTAVIAAPGNQQDLASRSDTWTLTVTAPSALRISKVADVPVVEIQPDLLSWTISWTNTLATTAGRTTWIDVLPHVGDGRGTAANGTFGLQSATLLGDSADVTLEVTDLDPATVDTRADHALNTTPWCAVADVGTVGCPADMSAVTALRFTNADLRAGEIGGLRLVAAPQGNHGGDVYVNRVESGLAEGIAQAVPPTPNSTIEVLSSSIGDVVWWDLDVDGVQDPDEDGVPDVRVRLLDGADVEVASTTTDADGVYRFSNLHSGAYRVVVDGATLPAGIVSTYDLDGGTTSPDLDSGAVALGVDLHRPAVDFGIVEVGTTLQKRVVEGPTRAADGTDTVVYELVVRNVGAAPTTYDLHDELHFGAGITPVAHRVDTDAPATIRSDWNGSTTTLLAAGVPMAGGATHTYTVAIDAVVGTDASADGRACADEGSPGGFANHGWTVDAGIAAADPAASDACVVAQVAAGGTERSPVAANPPGPVDDAAAERAPLGLAFTGSSTAARLLLGVVLGACGLLALWFDRRARRVG